MSSSAHEPEIISQEELVAQADFTPYVLSTVPEGYTMEINAVNGIEVILDGQEQEQTPSVGAYAIASSNDSGEYLALSESSREPFAGRTDEAEEICA